MIEYVTFTMPLGNLSKIDHSICVLAKAVERSPESERQVLMDTLSVLKGIRDRAPGSKVELRPTNVASTTIADQIEAYFEGGQAYKEKPDRLGCMYREWVRQLRAGG